MASSARIPFTLAAAGALAFALLGGCATPAGPQAVAQLQPTKGSNASGAVRDLQGGGGVAEPSVHTDGMPPGAQV